MNTIKAASANHQTIAELHYKDACKYATAAEDLTSGYTEDHVALTITKIANGVVTIDGGTLVLDDHILVKDQTDTKENGIYKVTQLGSESAPLILTREDHFNSSTECESGKVYFVIVSSGSTNAHKSAFIGVGTESTTTTFGTTTFSVTATLAASEITVADESTDTTCFPVFTTAATGNRAPKTGTNLTFNSDTGVLTATGGFIGDLTGNASLTGIPTADTAALGTNTTQLATTKFVNNASDALYSSVSGDATISATGVLSINPHRSIVATNIALNNQETDTSCNVVFSSDEAPLEGGITVNKATYANNSITRASYVSGDPGYKSQVLFPVAPAGYARIDFRRTAGFILYAGLVLNTENPVANDTATGYSELYALNFKNDNNVRLYHDDGIQAGGINITTWSSDDLFSIVYYGGHGSSTSGKVVYMKNHVDLGHTQTGLASDLIFHAKFEDYLQSSDTAPLVTVDKISFYAAPTVHTSEKLTYNSNTGLLTATGFAGPLTGNVTGNTSGSSGSCTGNSSTATTATNVTVTNEESDSTCFPLFVTAAATNGGAKTSANFQLDTTIGSGAVSLKIAGGTTSLISCTGDITAFASDKRLKTDIEIISNPLDKINKITGFTYCWDKEVCDKIQLNTDDNRHIGVFAQDIQAVLPEAVKPAPFDTDSKGNSKSGDNYLTVQYEKIVPLLIECIKEQQTQIEELRNEVELLKK